MDGDNNDATSIVPTGAIVCSRVRVDRMFTAIERKIETLGLLNEIREFPQLKFVTNVTRLFLLRDPILHPCQFSNNELIAIRKAFCYPFCSHLAIFQARVFESFFSITCSRDEDHRYQSICMYIHIYLIFDEERICPILFAKKKFETINPRISNVKNRWKVGGLLMEQSGNEDVGKRQHANEIFLPFFSSSFRFLPFLFFSFPFPGPATILHNSVT